MRTFSPQRRLTLLAFVFAFSLAIGVDCGAYSVLTHEAIIDSAWDPAIKPLLLERFPNASHDELRAAHAYAYGGSVVQDMGYYPFGSNFFSDLLHYVRTADFIDALLRDSASLNDYAFALGTLAHYSADNNGHRLAVNLAVPMLYPKLRAKYGDRIVYDQNPAAHLKTEFGFDVLQVARGRYAPDDYRDHIGFEVDRPLLERAFEETYCLKLESLFSSYDLAIGSYRRGVSAVIPTMTKVAWQVKKDEIQKEIPGITRKKFLYHLSRSSYEKRWSQSYKEPGFGTKFLAFVIRLIPKVGPFRALGFRTPTPATEHLFMQSFNASVDDYQHHVEQERQTGNPGIANDNFDTGDVTGPGQYPLADKTYAELVGRLAKTHFSQVTPELRADILNFYKDTNAPFSTRKNKKEWARVMEELSELKNASPKPSPTAAASSF